ncbi:MAG: MOSC domain-containing protein [Candidatus Omnitrophota bacterium]|nr:MOSC domain-containing protein [Candidatus Omnitrophota bacterium]
MKEGKQKLTRSNPKGRIAAVSISRDKGTKKTNVPEIILKENFGIMGDAHAGTGNRQVSLLAEESIEKIKAKGIQVKAGDFAENITTQGLDLLGLDIGTKLKIGLDVILELTQKGKECHTRCSIYYQAGDCVMPKEGVFAKVVKGGNVKPGDEIIVY